MSSCRSRWERDDPGSYQVVDQYVDVDEQVLGGQHGLASAVATVLNFVGGVVVVGCSDMV